MIQSGIGIRWCWYGYKCFDILVVASRYVTRFLRNVGNIQHSVWNANVFLFVSSAFRLYPHIHTYITMESSRAKAVDQNPSTSRHWYRFKEVSFCCFAYSKLHLILISVNNLKHQSTNRRIDPTSCFLQCIYLFRSFVTKIIILEYIAFLNKFTRYNIIKPVLISFNY